MTNNQIELARAMVPLSAPRRAVNTFGAGLLLVMMPARFCFDFIDTFSREYSHRVFAKGGVCGE